jgi:hypothetical protein
MSYHVTGKNLALGRLMVRGKNAEPRLKYLHCGPQGMSVITPTVVARVSLPDAPNNAQPTIGPIIYSQADVDAMKRPAPESPEIACEVCNDSEKVMRLRYDKGTNALRIDTYRQPGE